MNGFFDIFISYGRADSKAFATKLHQKLTSLDLKVWFDQNDIPPAVDWQQQIDDGIERTHNFIFIIAPHAVNSVYCLKEIELALKYNKRIIPLVHVKSDKDKIHPTIRKLNWIYFQEEIDDFDSSFEKLINSIRQHADYVEQHTQFLAKALEWKRNHQKNKYLLIQSERIKAESWLRVRFTDEQPPCLPTDLHCEFICESTKNANNLMTEVFIAHADKDQVIREKIVRTLMREGLTIWTNKTDIKTGAAYQNEINKGIEQADNFVYLISPESIRSKYCQQELEHAFAHHKRIIPVLVGITDLVQSPPELKGLQFIDLTEYQDAAQYLSGVAKLLKELSQDASYYQDHKLLLVKAIKWQEQNKNPSILLRGYNLDYYKSWLAVAQKRRNNPPLPLQEEFIAESTKQPTESLPEVFISYSRTDSDFARKLNEALQLQGKTTWFDQESIPPGTDFQQEIYRGIEASENFLFIISQNSISSPYCDDEVAYAQKLHKRFVTVLYGQKPSSELHPALSRVQWIDFQRHGGDFYANFSEVIRTLDTDREHVRNHTKWSQRSLEWKQKDQSADLLLRGSELAIAQAWLQETQQQNKQPPATDLQTAYIEASEELQTYLLKQEEKRQQKELEYERKQRKAAQKLTTLALSAAIVTTGLSVLAGFLYRNSLIAQIRAYRASSEAELLSNQQLDALVSSLRTGQKLNHPVLQLFRPEASLNNRVIGTLRKVFYSAKERNRLEVPQGRFKNFVFTPNSKQLLVSTAGADGMVNLWDASGKQLAQFPGHQNQFVNVSFSRDGKLVATAENDGTVRLWNSSGKQLAQFKGHQNTITSMIFSPNGKQLATASSDGAARLWDLSGRKIAEYKGPMYGVLSIGFSPNGRLLIATIKDYGNFSLLDLSGKQIAELKTQGQGQILDVTFSPDGKKLVGLYGEESGYAILWNLEQKPSPQPIGLSEARSVSFSPDSQQIATVGSDGIVRLWSLFGEQLNQFQGHRGSVWNVIFSPDGKQLASSGADNTVRLWDSAGKQLNQLQSLQSEATSISLSPNGKQLATVSNNGTFRLFNLAGKQLTQFPQLQTKVNSISFSPDGDKLATALEDGTIALWDASGGQLAQFKGHQKEAISVSFSPDSKRLATAGDNNTVRLWDLSGKQLAEYRQYLVRSVSFTPDGKLLIASVGNYGGNFGTVFLSDSSGKQLSVFPANQGEDISISFSPDSSLLATAGQDGITKLWYLSGKELITFKGHQGRVSSTSFNVDGSTLATAGEDGTIKLWQVGGLDNLLSRGCNWIGDYLNNNAPEEDQAVCNGIN